MEYHIVRLKKNETEGERKKGGEGNKIKDEGITSKS